MPHETYVEQTTETRDSTPLSPILHAKLFAKHNAHRKTRKVSSLNFEMLHTLTPLYSQGDLARGMSIVDHDLDEEDSSSSLTTNSVPNSIA